MTLHWSPLRSTEVGGVPVDTTFGRPTPGAPKPTARVTTDILGLGFYWTCNCRSGLQPTVDAAKRAAEVAADLEPVRVTFL